MQRKIILTKDGSHSLLVEQMGETFHSRHGALQEAVHVYIENGLKRVHKEDLRILEFGFGTGLNALLSCKYATENQIKVHYETIEAYPLVQDEYSVLNYNNLAIGSDYFLKLHEIPWNQKKATKFNDYFAIIKHLSKFEDFKTVQKFDLIYFDVFGYDYQPELWDQNILQKTYDLLKTDGLWVTYACKGLVNRNMKEIGFEVLKLQGPPGKREMTIAYKK